MGTGVSRTFGARLGQFHPLGTPLAAKKSLNISEKHDNFCGMGIAYK
jgi:hypothetical protein